MSAPAADHDYASAQWVINDVWLSYEDIRAWLTGAFVSNEDLYVEYAAAVAVINIDRLKLRAYRRSARGEDMNRARKLARVLDAEQPGIPLVQRGPTVGLLATAGRRTFLSEAGQILHPHKRHGTRGTYGIYVRNRLHQTPFLPEHAEPWAWPATPNIEGSKS
jgi:hypothetical protein